MSPVAARAFPRRLLCPRASLALAGLLGGFSLGSAAAGDLPSAPPEAVAAPAPFTWTGVYLGAQLGWAGPRAQYDITVTSPNDGRDRSSPDTAQNGILGGGFVGYMHQFDRLVVGAEADLDFVIAGKIRTAAGKSFITAHTNYFGSVRGRLGWAAADRVLLYGTGGLALQSPVTRVPTTAIAVRFGDDLRVGWTAGGGAEYAMSDNWIAGVEYRFSSYEEASGSYKLRRTKVEFSQERQVNQVVGRVSYKF